MSVFRDTIAALLGVSTYASAKSTGMDIDDARAERMRRGFGGQLSPVPQAETQWFLDDLFSAIHEADTGNLSRVGRLSRAMRRDGVYSGVISTSTDGLVSLPKRFSGNEELVRELEGRDGQRSVFDAMFPPAELALMAYDSLVVGVSVGELLPVEGRDYPVLVRLDPEWLRYLWSENRWYYQSTVGALPITPGDGRWVLHTQGGRIAPWQNGLWPSLGQAWIDKQHALLHAANWQAKLANPARVAYAPAGANDSQRQGFIERLIAWGINTVFELPPGWDAKILESNGRGHESFAATIARSEREYMIGIAGQVITTDGGTGFSNMEIHKAIRADLIRMRAKGLAHTINTQGIPAWAVAKHGIEALSDCPAVEWDTTPPKDLKGDADAMTASAKAIADCNSALSSYGLQVDARQLAIKFGIPTLALPKSDNKAPTVQLAPTDMARILRVNEGRASAGLGPLELPGGVHDLDGDLTIEEFAAKKAAQNAPKPADDTATDTQEAA